MDRYFALFEAKTGQKPVVQGAKDAALLKRLVKARGIEDVLAGLEWFLGDHDPFVVQAGYSLGAISSCWRKFQAREVQKTEPTPTYLKPAKIERGPAWGGSDPQAIGELIHGVVEKLKRKEAQ